MAAMLLLEADLSLPVLLEHLVEEARSMVGARYGALGVLNTERTALAQFVTVGLDPDQEKAIGPRPTGQGVLGLLINEPEPLRMPDIRSHGNSYGFPPGHPPMTSFLGVPVKVRDEVYGNLYLTDKVGWSEFTEDDEHLVGALALAAGIAIENARLHQQVQEFAVLDDRDRIARDLHDAVIQRLFAIGLSLQGLTKSVAATGVAERLTKAVSDIDDTIRQIRTTIFELGSGGLEQSVRADVLSLVREFDVILGFEVEVRFDGPVDTAIPNQVSEHLLATIRESLTNVGRHAQATAASVTVAAKDQVCSVRILDNGVGFDLGDRASGDGGLGLGNLRRRAEKLKGKLVIERRPEGGSALLWRVPLSPA